MTNFSPALTPILRPDGQPLWQPGASAAISGTTARLVLPLPASLKAAAPRLETEARAAILAAHPALDTVHIVFTDHTQATAARASADGKLSLPGIGRIVAVASGKGGVGKSTLALAIARTLRDAGARTGLLDADIYGPSLPTLLATGARAQINADKTIQPVVVENMPMASLGFMVEPDKAVIWRGPMVMGAVLQLFRDVAWPTLDTLVVDMPPGTGDAQLTLAQKIPVQGAIIVTTPHPLSLADARRAVAMFRKTDVPVWGLVENMAWIEGQAGERLYPFGPPAAENLATEMGIPFWGQVPLQTGSIVLDHKISTRLTRA